MNIVIENWVDKMPVVLFVMSVASWFMAGILWNKQYQLPLRIVHSVGITSFAMVLLGAFVAFIVSIPVIPDGNIQKAIAADFVGLVMGFTEIGLETIAIWLPVIFLRVAFLTLRDRRQ